MGRRFLRGRLSRRDGCRQYTSLTQEVNRQLKALCEERADYMTFVDAQAMTFDGKTYATDLFISDQIHLNHEGQLRWCQEYIRPALEEWTATQTS